MGSVPVRSPKAVIAPSRRSQRDALAVLDQAQELAADGPLGDLLVLCRLRIRMLLLGSLSADDLAGSSPKARALAEYPTSSLFSDLERRALEFTEQYVMDVGGMSEELVAGLQQLLGPKGLYSLAMGLYVVDQSERLALSAQAHPRSH